MTPLVLGEPAPLAADHDTSRFVCKHESLGTWVGKRALGNAASGASLTYVVCDTQRQVVGYCALSAGSIAATQATGRLRSNMPDPFLLLGLHENG